jgi:hypothetical protein
MLLKQTLLLRPNSCCHGLEFIVSRPETMKRPN